MHPILKNILAGIAGAVIGSVVNMQLVNMGHSIFPMEGVDPMDMEALAEAMPNLSPEFFVFPFLAHALGTLVGATLAAWLAAKFKMSFAIGIGVLFFIGGVMATFMIPAPMWFLALDLIVAYFPMAWIGGKLGIWLSSKTNRQPKSPAEEL